MYHVPGLPNSPNSSPQVWKVNRTVSDDFKNDSATHIKHHQGSDVVKTKLFSANSWDSCASSPPDLQSFRLIKGKDGFVKKEKGVLLVVCTNVLRKRFDQETLSTSVLSFRENGLSAEALELDLLLSVNDPESTWTYFFVELLRHLLCPNV
jgi:hypothetical protein